MLDAQLTDLHALIESSNWTATRELLRTLPHAEIAEVLFEIDQTDRMILFRLLPYDISADVFAQLEYDEQNTLLKELTLEETRRLLTGLSPDDRTALLEELPGQVTQRLLNLLAPEDLAETRKLLGYPEESVGRLMTPDYVAVRPDWTLAQALTHIRKRGKQSETVNVIYVTDKSWRLLDALGLKSFVFNDPELLVSDIMDYNFISLYATEDREEAVRTMERYDLAIVPVVDTTGVLVGIVTFDDVLDIAELEATEDIHKGAAVSPILGNYGQVSFLDLYTKRIGWLLALVFVNIFSGAIIANYEDIIATHVALVFFLPLLIASSGNAGSQASTLLVRALAMGDVEMSDWGSLLFKEIFVAAALGGTMAVVVAAIGTWRGGPEVGLVVALTMVLIVIVGSIIGTLLPFILSILKFDPATASAPLITSLSDISGVLIYFLIATLILSNQGDHSTLHTQADAIAYDWDSMGACGVDSESCLPIGSDAQTIIAPQENTLNNNPFKHAFSNIIGQPLTDQPLVDQSQ